MSCFASRTIVKSGNPSLGIPHHTMLQTLCTQNRPVNIVNEYANEPALHLHITVILKPAIQTQCYAWEEREILTREAYFNGPWWGQYWELGVMIGLILLENIYIF
jgi:hypothetical protein